MDEAKELLLSNRRFMYAFACRAFASEPDDTFLAVVSSAHAKDECELVDGLEHAGEALWNAVNVAASEVGLARLRCEYTKLFVGPAKLAAPPWESVYVSAEPLLFQESTLAVREAYRRFGYAAAGYPRIADDHAAIELEFMATMATETLNAEARGDEARAQALLKSQLGFLEEHLLVWLSLFADRVESCNVVSGFYPSLARLAALVCERDAEVIEELLAA